MLKEIIKSLIEKNHSDTELCNKLSSVMDLNNYTEIIQSLEKLGFDRDFLSLELEKLFGYKFLSPRNIDFDNEVFSKLDINPFLVNGIIPFIDDGEVAFIVSNKTQINFIELQNFKTDRIYCCFDFEIEDRIKTIVEDDKNGITDLVIAEDDTRKRVIMASGQTNIDELVKHFDGYNVVHTVQYREHLLDKCREYNPNILLVGDNIGGKKPLTTILVKIKQELPDIRIIYFTGELDFKDDIRVTNLGILATLGIHDIIPENKMSIQLVQHILASPRGIESVKNIISKMRDSTYTKKKSVISVTLPEDEVFSEDMDTYKQLHSFISTKGGTGKSFIVNNVAIAIATMGVNSLSGKKPRIAIVDTDLSGFNVSNLCGVNDDKRNILVALKEVKKVISNKGDLIGSEKDVAIVSEAIKKCLVPHPTYKNIEILGGTSKSYDDTDSKLLRVDDFVYLLENFLDDYDVVLIDVNSSAEYGALFPLFSMSRNLYFVMDMDYNCFMNNKRQQTYLNSIGNPLKFKYILNKFIDDPESKMVFNVNRMEEDLDYSFEAKVPKIDDIQFLNSICTNKPIITDTTKETLLIRYEILKIATQLWPIKNFDKIEAKMNELLTPVEIEEESKKEGFALFVETVTNLINGLKNKKPKDKKEDIHNDLEEEKEVEIKEES